MNTSIAQAVAARMIALVGYDAALRGATTSRDNSSEGTATFALHNEVVKAIAGLSPESEVR